MANTSKFLQSLGEEQPKKQVSLSGTPVVKKTPSNKSTFIQALHKPTFKEAAKGITGISGKLFGDALGGGVVKTLKPIATKTVEKLSPIAGTILEGGKALSLEAPYKQAETIANISVPSTKAEKLAKGQALVGGLVSGILPESLSPELPTPKDDVENALSFIGENAGIILPIGAEYGILTKAKAFSNLIKARASTPYVGEVLSAFSKRTIGRVLRGSVAGAGYSIYKSQTDPKEIAENAAMFAAFDGGLGIVSDIVKTAPRLKAELDSLGVADDAWLGSRERLYSGLRSEGFPKEDAIEVYKKTTEKDAEKIIDDIKIARMDAEDVVRTAPKQPITTPVGLVASPEVIDPIVDAIPYKLSSESVKMIQGEAMRIGATPESIFSQYKKLFSSSKIGPDEMWKIEHYTDQGYSLADAIRMVEPEEVTIARHVKNGMTKDQADAVMRNDRLVLTKKYEASRGSFSTKKVEADYKTYNETSGKTDVITPEYESRFKNIRSTTKDLLEKKLFAPLREVATYWGGVRTQMKQGILDWNQFNLSRAITNKTRQKILYKRDEVDMKIIDLIRPILEMKNIGKFVWAGKNRQKLLEMVGDYSLNLRILRQYEKNPEYRHHKTLDEVTKTIEYYKTLDNEGGRAVIMTADNIIKHLKRYANDVLIPKDFLKLEQVESNPDYFPLVVLDFCLHDAGLGMGKLRKPFLGHTVSAFEGSYRVHSRDVVEVLREYFFQFERRMILDAHVEELKQVFYKKEMYDAFKVDGSLPEGYGAFYYDGNKHTFNGKAIVEPLLKSVKNEIKPIIDKKYQDLFEQLINGDLRAVLDEKTGKLRVIGKGKEPILMPQSLIDEIEKGSTPGTNNILYSSASGSVKYLKKAWIRGVGFLTPFWPMFNGRNLISDFFSVLRDGGIKYLATAYKHLFKLFRMKPDELTKIMTASEKDASALNLGEKSAMLPPDIADKVRSFFLSHGGAQTGHFESVTGSSVVPHSGRFLELETNPFRYVQRQWRSKMMEGRLGYDTFRAFLESGTRLARLYDATEKQWKKVLSGEMSRADFDKYGFSNAFEEMGDSMINYLETPQWKRDYLNNLFIPFNGWTDGNARAFYEALAHGNARQRIIAIGGLAASAIAIPVLNQLNHPEIVDSLNDPDKPWLKNIRDNFYLPLNKFTGTDGKEYAEILSFSTGLDDFLRMTGMKSLTNAWIAYGFGKQNIWDTITDTFASPFTGFPVYMWENASPLVKKMSDYYNGRDSYSQIQIYNPSDPSTEKTLKVALDALLTISRTGREYSQLLNGEEWAYNSLVKNLGEDMAKDIYEYLKIKQTYPPGWRGKMLRLFLSKKTVRLDAPEERKSRKKKKINTIVP